MKSCKDCGLAKPLDAFYRHPESADGYLSTCKECKKAQRKAWYHAKADDRRAFNRAYDRSRRRPDTPEQIRQYRESWQARHPDRHKAHTAVMNALRLGQLQRQPCEDCGAEKAQAHHDDYSKPLDVRWLCRRHHMERHRKSA